MSHVDRATTSSHHPHNLTLICRDNAQCMGDTGDFINCEGAAAVACGDGHRDIYSVVSNIRRVSTQFEDMMTISGTMAYVPVKCHDSEFIIIPDDHHIGNLWFVSVDWMLKAEQKEGGFTYEVMNILVEWE